MTRWKMASTNYIDYVVIAGDTQKRYFEIIVI